MTQPMILKFSINHPGDRSAGILSFNDTITVRVESGDPGGDRKGEYCFGEFILQSLQCWFDGAGVTLTDILRGD